MAWLSAPSGDFSDLHGRFQHLSLTAHVPICHFNGAGRKLPTSRAGWRTLLGLVLLGCHVPGSREGRLHHFSKSASQSLTVLDTGFEGP